MQGCYLLCFESKLAGRAGHYLGWSANLRARIAAHEAGNSAKLIHAIHRHGIRFQVVRLWLGADRETERKYKRQKDGRRLCPVCQGKVGAGYSIDVKRTLFEKADPWLATPIGKRRPMEVCHV